MVTDAELDEGRVVPGSRATRCLVMGVVNVTPDSFSDGGRFFDTDAAVAHGRQLLADGADLLDVGGESTRPGAVRVDKDEELRRVIPVIRELAADGVRVSVDTMRSEVAEKAVRAGAAIINDVSAGQADPDMACVAADLGASYVAMHWRGHAAVMEGLASYDDVVAQVRDELSQRVDHLLGAGIRPDRLILDPGLGFAKRPHHNWHLLRHLGVLAELGFPLLVGASRKRFLAQVADREDATVAVSALAAAAGVWAVRVHQVRPNVAAVRVAAAWTGAGG